LTIQAICFDADGVIVNPMLQFARRLAEEYGITRETTRGFFTGPFNDCLTGKARLQDNLPPFLDRWGWPGSVDAFIHEWLVTDHVVDRRLMTVIQRLRREGVTCCLATSQECNRAAYMRTSMGFLEAFDHLFISCEVGAQKPDHAFYTHIEAALGLQGAVILFFDDSPANVAAARQCGWQAEVYTTFEEFERSLEKYF
jgi:putative hydrolase of the HAD superfamily